MEYIERRIYETEKDKVKYKQDKAKLLNELLEIKRHGKKYI